MPSVYLVSVLNIKLNEQKLLKAYLINSLEIWLFLEFNLELFVINFEVNKIEN